MAAIAYNSVVTANTNGTPATSLLTGGLGITTTNNYVVVAVCLDNASATVTSVFDWFGNIYTRQSYSTNTGCRVEIWTAWMFCYFGASANTDITVVASTSCNIAIAAASYGNVEISTAATPYGNIIPVLSYTEGTGTSYTLTNVQQGNLLVAIVGYSAGYNASFSVSDSASFNSGWSRLAHGTSGTSYTVEIWSATAGTGLASGSSDVITTTTGQLCIAQFSGYTNVLDGSASGTSGSGTTQTAPSITTTPAGDLIIGGFFGAAACDVTTNSPYLYSRLAYSTVASLWFLAPGLASTAYAPFGTGVSGAWAAVSAAFKGSWAQAGVPLQRNGVTTGTGLTVGSLTGSMPRGLCQTSDSASWEISAIGWSGASGDAVASVNYNGTVRGTSAPAYTTAMVTLVDNYVGPLCQMANIVTLNTNRNWATASVELRGTGGVVAVPTFPLFAAGGILPSSGGGQIFPVSVKAQ